MDERQSQIREGAGLEESRINTDFVDFLKKWGPRFLTLVIVVSAIWLFFRFRTEQRDTRLQQGFNELQSLQTGGTASPESLLQVAETYEGVRGVPHIARLAAADTFLDSVRRGLEPGTLVQMGGVVDEADVLDEQSRAAYLDRAGALYQRVYDDTRNNDDARLHTLGALFGMASVAESRADGDEARRWYETAQTMAIESGFVEFADAAESRLADLDEAMEMVLLLSDEDLPTIPGELPPVDPNQFDPNQLDPNQFDPSQVIQLPDDLPAGPTEPETDPAEADPATDPANADGDAPQSDPAAEPPAGG